MQKGTVIEGEVMHRDFSDACADGAKPCEGFSSQNRKDACSNPARIPKKETVTASAKDNSSNDKDLSNPLRTKTGNAKGAASHARRFSKNIGRIASRAAAVFVAAVMTVSLGMFSSGAFDMASTGAQSAYATTGTTPYTNIDVPLTTNRNGGSADGNDETANATGANDISDNAMPNRAEAGDEVKAGKGLEAGILGPILSPVSSRASEGEGSSNDGASSDGDTYITYADTYIEGAYTYGRMKDGNGDDAGKVRLVKVDPTVGKVARIEANVSEIAPGAFTECDELATLIVFGNVKSIAHAQYDADGNLTQEGAFTDEQIKNVHVVFATTYLDEASLHETHPVGSDKDTGDNADVSSADKTDGIEVVGDTAGNNEADNRDGTGANMNATSANAGSDGAPASGDNDNVDVNDGNSVDSAGGSENAIAAKGYASESSTPVEEGIKRLSGDVMLSAPSIKDSKDNIWMQTGFENIVDTPQIGAKGKALEDSTNDGSDDDKNDGSTNYQNGDQTYANATNANNANGADGSFANETTHAGESITANVDENSTVDADGVSGEIQNDNFTYTLLSDYTLEATWNGDSDTPADLVLPDYGQVEDTIYDISQGNSLFDSFKNGSNFGLYSTRSTSSNETVTINLPSRRSEWDNRDYWTGIPESAMVHTDIDSSYPGKSVLTMASVTSYKDGTLVYPAVSLGAYETNSGKVVPSISFTFLPSDSFDDGETVAIKRSISNNLPSDYGTEPDVVFRHLADMGITFDCGVILAKSIKPGVGELGCNFYWLGSGPPRNVTVSLNANGGSVSPSSITCQTGGTYGSLPYPTRSSYTFDGWYTSPTGGTRVYSSSTLVSDSSHTLYAHWSLSSFTVSFNANGGSGGQSADVTATYGESMPAISTTKPTRTGYTFGGWYDTSASSGGTQYYTASCTSARTWDKESGATLYARWTPNKYTVSFDANGGSGGQSADVTATYDANMPTISTTKPTRTGYTFGGWYDTSASTGGTQYYTASCTSSRKWDKTSNTTLYARWTANTYTVTYSKNKPGNASSNVAGTTANSSHTYDTSKALTANGYSLTGWTFKGWNTKSDGTGTSYANSASVKNLTSTPNGTVTLYAQWTANTYYVSYEANFTKGKYPNSTLLYDGTPSSINMPLSTHTYDTAKELSANLYGVTGYDFDGWSSNSSGTGTQYADRKSVKNLSSTNGATVILYAKWALHTYTIDVNALGGKMPSATPNSYTINSSTISIGNPTRPGYDFYGWSVTGAGEHGRQPILNTDPAQIATGTYGNLLFTASWGEIEYRVQYNFNGGVGNAIGAQTATYGKPFTVAKGTGVISRDGYAFSGYWNTFPDGSGNSYREGTSAMNLTMLSGDTVVLYAVWNANRYPLTLDAQGGTLPDAANWTPSDDRSKSTKQVAFDSPMGTLLVPTRQGYEFAGWYNDLGENVTSTTVYSQAAPMTLYARWTPHVYDVYFYKGEVGATGSMEPLQFYYGTEKPLTPNNFEYEGHTFLGWSRTQGATVPAYRDGEAVSNLTTDQNGVVFLYAVWSENHYSINYYANGAEVAEGFDEPHHVEDVAYADRFYPPKAGDLGYSMTGYAFAGWSEDRNAETGRYQPTDEASSITDQDGVTVNLWAIWTPMTYRLTLDATGGRFDATLFQTVGQIWSPETNYVGAYRQIRYDEQYLCTIEPKQTGYDFAGWYDAPQSDPYVAGSGDGVPVSASDPFRNLEDTTLYAHWTPHTYTLNLVYHNSESMTDTILLGQTLRFNEPFVLPTAGYRFEDPNLPSYGHTLKDYQKTGFAVSGWSITRNGETNYRLGETISGLDAVGDPDRPYTLYLTQAAGRYTVEFDPGVAPGVDVENLMLPQTWLYTDYVDVPWCSMRRTGYTFTHWTTNVDDRTYTPGYGQRFHGMVDIGETLVLTAHWKANEITLRFMGTHKEGVADKTITYDTQISSVPEAVSDRKCTFEGWWTKKDGSLDECYFDWSGNVNQDIDAIFPYWRDAGNENGVVELWARWTFEVSFEFPYGGTDPSIHPSNYSAGQTYGDPSNANNYQPSYGLPTPNYDGFDSNKDSDGNVRRFAGWYDKPVGGNLVTNDTLATGPVRPRPGADYEDVVLYARWYVDVTLDYPTYAPYVQGWEFEYGRDLAHVENDRGQVVVSYVQGIPYAGDRSFQLGLPRAERAGYAYLGWNANERQVIDDGEPALFEGEIQSRDTVTSERNYTMYLEYAKRKVDVTVRHWQQVIEGVDADGNPTIGSVPAIASSDVYTTNGHYKLVEADTRTEGMLSETQLVGDDWHEDPSTEDGRYRGFTYSTTLISKDANGYGGTDPDSLLVWDGKTTPEQARPGLYDGCVASDGTSVIDVFYTRNRYDVTLHDFEVVDGAGEAQVRGSAHARANSSNDLAYSPAEASELPGRTQTLSAWYEEEVTAVGRSWAGYDFSGWDIEPTELGYSKDVVSEDPSVRVEGDVYTFAVTDSDMDVTPRCTPRDDTEYHATLHYQGLTSATSVEEDRETWPTSARIRLTGTTDALTDWVVRANAADPNAANVIEGKAVGTSDFNMAGFPEDVAFDGTYAFDPHGFTGVDLQNVVIRAESDEAIHVYYARNAYSMDVVGYEATHKDGTPVGDEGRIEAYLWDNMAGGPAERLENASVDAGQDRNKASYSIYFHAPLSVVAVPHEGTELLGYASSNADIWNAKGLAEYASDLGIMLDANPLVDSAGLANASPNNPYTFKYEGESSPYNMPIVPDDADGTKGTLVLTIEGQPARTSYEVVTMLQDAGTETEPTHGSYTRHPETRTFDGVTEDAGTRLLRYWQDGTYVSTNADDERYVPAMEGFGLSDSYTPTLFGYETFDGHGIVDLIELTPEGNAAFHGTSNAPLNKAYIYMDRNVRSLGYEYVVDDGYSDVVSLDDAVTSTLPSAIGTYFGAEVKVAGDPSANGWEFLGWTWAADPDMGRDDFPYVGEDTDSPSVTIPDFDVEITGTWAPIEYGLSFDGGTAYDESPATNLPEAMSIPFNSEWAVPDDVPARNGYTFLGWTFADSTWDARLADQPTMDETELAAYTEALKGTGYLGGVPLLMLPGDAQGPWSHFQEDSRTLHAVWMRNAYALDIDLAEGAWPTGTDVPLNSYMTGSEIKIPVPACPGHSFIGWEVECAGTGTQDGLEPLECTDKVRATINKWTWGDIALTAKWDVVRYDAALNAQGGTFDGTYVGTEDGDIKATYPEGDAPYKSSTLSIPYGKELDIDTPLPEPTRPGYEFAGWTDAEGNPIGWTLDDDGNKVDAPYTFDDAADTTWIATWRAKRYTVAYDFGEYAGTVTINDADRFSEYHAGMTDASGNAVTSFMLPTASDLSGIPKNVSFDGWYPQGGNPDKDLMRSFDPNAEAGDKEFVARFSTGANAYTERFWLEVLDQAEDDPGKQYAFIGDVKFALDESLSVTRRTNSPNAQASMSAIAGFTSVNPYDESGVSIYPTEHPYVCVFSAGQNVVNGFYAREAHSLTVGTANGIDDGETLIQVSPVSALVKGTDAYDGAYGEDEAANVATLKGASSATVKWGARLSVGVSCSDASGYRFVAWRTDAGATPADIDVRSNPATFTMPDADVALNPSTEPMRFKATYKDAFGKEIEGIAQGTFTVEDEFALANLDADSRHGYTFDRWVAYVADSDGNKLDTETNPVPETVGYDDSHQYMRVRPGTTSNLLFEAIYVANAYTVTIEVPAQAVRDSSGYPVGLERDDRLGWSVDAETGDVSFTYTPDTLGPTDEPIEIDLSTIKVHPYKVEGWKAEADASNSDEDAPPTLTGATIALKAGDTGSTTVKPTGVIPITFEVVIDPNQEGCIPEGYEIDKEKLKEDMDRLIEEIEGSDSPSKPVITENEDGSWTIEFDVTSEPQVTLPRPVLVPTDPDDPNTPEGKYDFLGWADNEDGTNPTLDYTLPSGNLDDFEEGVPVRPKPVWTPSGEEAGKASIHVYLPDNERIYHVGDAASEWTFAFSGAPLAETKDAYAADEGFAAKCTSTDGYHLGYHLEWYGDFDEDAGTPTGGKLASLPANFPETGDIHIWGVWVQDDDIKPVGFNNVSFGTSGPPGFSGGRSRQAYAFARAAYANVTYYYKPSIGLVVKDEANDTFVKVEYIDESIMSAVDQYLDAGWLFDGYYLEGDDAKEVIIASDGKVDQELLRQKTEGRDIDLAFSDSWTRKQLVRIDLVGGTGDKAKVDATLYWWPDLDVFISPSNPAILNEDRKAGISNTIERRYTAVELDEQGLATPGARTNEDGSQDEFLGYFGRDASGLWPKDEGGACTPAAFVERLGAIGVTETYLDTFKDASGKEVSMPYGCDLDAPYDPTSEGYCEIKWEAKWEGDFDTVYFNATVPMSMSFMVKPDGTAVGPDAGAYQIRNYSNTAISVEDMSFAWADESELEALFGKGAAGALALSATPTVGQDGYVQTKVLLERANATQDAVGSELISKHAFDTDKWVIAKSIGVDPDKFTGNAEILPALKLDYELTTGGLQQLTQENTDESTTHRIGTLKFTLKTVR